MKQVDKKYICYYCLGCNAEEQENFEPRQRCKGFVPRIWEMGKDMEKGAKEEWISTEIKKL